MPNDHTFNYGNKFYFIDSPIKLSIVRHEIEIRQGKYEQSGAYFVGRYLQVKVTKPVETSMENTGIQKKLDVLALTDKLGNVA